MIYVDVVVFLRNTERYIDMACKGTNVYICLPDGVELKLSKYLRQ